MMRRTMLAGLGITAIAGAALLASLGTMQQATAGSESLSASSDSITSSRNRINQEPVLVYDITGSTFAGSLHTSMVVYSNGLVSYSIRNQIIFSDPGTLDIDARVAFVGTDRVKRLREQLKGAGASTLTDSRFDVADIPLNTVTFFERPAPMAKANTFNYFGVSQRYRRVDETVREFIAETFGND